MTKGIGLPGKGIAYHSGGGGGPVPITKPMTFGYRASLTGLGTDTFNNLYMLYNCPASSTTEEAAFMRARSGDVLTSVTVGVGASAAGNVTVGLYSADNIGGPWTLVQKLTIPAAPTGTNITITQSANITLVAGKYYFLGINSDVVELVQVAATGGFKRWTAAAGVTPSPLADVDSSGSAYVAILYGTVNRTTNP